MTNETWSNLKARRTVDIFYPTTINNLGINPIWERFLIEQRRRIVYFIERLLENKVSLSQINIMTTVNSQAVYVGNKKYTRLAKNDYKFVLKHLQEKKVESKN